MCTVSVIPIEQGDARGFRLVTSRDEQRTRPPALAPAWRPVGERDGAPLALFPQDTSAGGTWVGATESGFVVCLLNLNPPQRPTPPPVETRLSRGLATLRMLEAGSIVEASRAAMALPASRLMLFRAILLETRPRGRGFGAALVTFDGRELDVAPLEGPTLCEASSGLGDHLVQDRLPLFAETVAQNPTPDAQDAYHRHRWVDRPAASVLMDRPDARTVSITSVDVLAGEGAPGASVRMRYEPIGEPGATPHVVTRRSPATLASGR